MLKSLTSAALCTAIMLVAGGPAAAQTRTIELAFLPPELEPQDVCNAADDAPADDLTVQGAEDDILTDRLRILYLGRDIRRLQAEDADRWFDFIDTLITRLAQVDPAFAGNDELLARIALHIDAGRLDDLRADALVDRLRDRADQLTNNQRLEVAQYYMTGAVVARDEDFARELILNAAFGGNANALLQLAQLDLAGTPVAGWDAPLDLTVTMAFGGLLGQMTPGVCSRAERIAQEYLNGTTVSRDPRIAYAWHKFAADMGSASGAWQVVEYHLNAGTADKDNAVMLHYLTLAAQRGIAISEDQIDALKATGAIDEQELQKIIGFNASQDRGRHRPSLSPLLNLAVNIDGLLADPDDSPFMLYLRELLDLPDVPGFVHTALAKEVLVRRGRWAGEGEAIELLETAAALRDGEGTRLLGKMLVRYRDDPRQINRAIALLTEAVSRHGLSEPLDDLDALHRCQAVDAPQMQAAESWARSYRAALHAQPGPSATDLIALDVFKEPLTVAQIQTQALEGRTQSLADFVQRVQIDPFARPASHRRWADQLDGSDQALEAFAKLEFELATNPHERDLAVELFRRIYLNNGVTTALDLAVTLVEDNGKHPEIAAEALDLLTRAANRGEGSAMRLKARLLEPAISARSVFEEFEQIIEERGDFLALMFALPFVSPQKAEDYVDRAVSLMNCTTKDVTELAEAHALRNAPDIAFHWQRISLAIAGGHPMSKMRLSDLQMADFDIGAAPTEKDVHDRALADGDATAHRRLYRLTADPDLATFDPARAADHLAALATSGQAGDQAWVLTQYRRAPAAVRDYATGRFDITDLYQQASRDGDTESKVEFALLLRDTARSPADLASSARLLEEAAEAGSGTAMTELGYVLAYGIGVPRAPDLAIGWLERATQLGQDRAEALVALLRLSGAGQ